MADDIERKVIDLIAQKKNLNPAAITLDSTFEGLGVDSLDAADLLFNFEDDFGIVVPDEVATSMKSVRQVVDGLRQILSSRAEAD
jgi:acyl carrier protein